MKKGFTLIELLIVIAIITGLAAVVLASLGNAKNKGEDAGIKSNLHTISNQAELFYLDNGNSYLPSGGSAFSIATCPTYDAAGTNMFSKSNVIADAIAEAVKRGNGSSCYNSANSWAVAVGLKLNAGTSWCVDNTGVAREVASGPLGAINPSTFTCN